MFCFPSAELAGKVDVPVVFHALVFALMQAVLLQIAIDKGVECNVCAVVRDVSQAIRRCNFAIILAQSGKDLNERREQFIDGIAVQVSAEVALLLVRPLGKKEQVGSLRTEKICFGRRFNGRLQLFGKAPCRLFGDERVGNGRWHTLIL